MQPAIASQAIKAGGLYIIGTFAAESKRVELQLRGRAGRQVTRNH